MESFKEPRVRPCHVSLAIALAAWGALPPASAGSGVAEPRVSAPKPQDQEGDFHAALAACEAARRSGDLRAARACLTAFLDARPPGRYLGPIQERLVALDAEMERRY